MERRLAAILAADVVGYTRLMGDDEAGTLRRLTELREQVLEPLIAEHRGRVVKLMGDGLLVEFSSVVDAVACAVAWQKGVVEREAEGDDDKPLQFRIGINLGDVIVAGDDIHGDGVNIAARLESLAESGGISLSGDAYRQVKGKIEVHFEDLGERDLKNVAEPIRVYRVTGDQSAVSASAPATDRLPLPDKPSIAVLPFTNMSGDPEQEYFSDGITEDIITELSRYRSLFVIARNSSFTFKGQAIDVTEIGKKLGVGYVVEGSVRKAGNRVRITAQLVEATSGNHLWAERYDRELEDIFAVQDEVVHEIAVAVPGQLDVAALQRAQRRPTENLTAYDLVLRGEYLRYQDWGSRESVALFEKAIEIDPQCARAHSHLANWHAYSILLQLAPTDDARELTRSFADRAAQIAPNDPGIQATLSDAYLMAGDPDMARRCIEKAIKLNPNDYVVMFYAGVVLAYVGDIDEALDWIEKFVRHDPLSISAHREVWFEAYYLARRYEDAINSLKGWRRVPPQLQIGLAAAHAHLGHMEEAQEARQQYENHLPRGHNFRDLLAVRLSICVQPKDRDNWIEGLRKAGFEV